AKLEELEPVAAEPEESEPADGGDVAPADADGTADNKASENLDPDAGKSKQQIIDEITGQLSLFDE
ncbi:MAG: hypothetical protein ACOCNA_05145, partial [Prevotella pectinovora]